MDMKNFYNKITKSMGKITDNIDISECRRQMSDLTNRASKATKEYVVKNFESEMNELIDLLIMNPSISYERKKKIIIMLTSVVCAIVAIQPIPFADIMILTPIQTVMVIALNKLADNPYKESDGKTIFASVVSVLGYGTLAQHTIIGLYKTGVPAIGGVMTIPLVYAATYGLGILASAIIEAKKDDREISQEEARKIYEDGRNQGKNEGEKHTKWSLQESLLQLKEVCLDYRKFMKGIIREHELLKKACYEDDYEGFQKHYQYLHDYIRIRIQSRYENIVIRNEAVYDVLVMLSAETFLNVAEKVIADISMNVDRMQIINKISEDSLVLGSKIGKITITKERKIEIKNIVLAKEFERSEFIAYLSVKQESIWFKGHNLMQDDIQYYVELFDRICLTPANGSKADTESLKDIFEKCLNKDCWDWPILYNYLGRPDDDKLKELYTDIDILLYNDKFALDSYVEKYNYFLDMFRTHLKNSDMMNFSDEDINRPIKNFEGDVWAQLDFESKKNLKIIERINQSISSYFLMFYFATMENEFRIHLLNPFIKKYGNKIVCPKKDYGAWKTNRILAGKEHFALGSIRFIGQYLEDDSVMRECEAIKKYCEFIGDRREEIVKICNDIGHKKINGIYLSNMRNGLAHGLPEIIEELDYKAYLEVDKFLLEKPEEMLYKIIRNSLKAKK